MAYLNFDRKEDNSYDCLYIILNDSGEEKKFSSGDILKDWYCVTKFFMNDSMEKEGYNIKISNELMDFISNSEYDIMNLSNGQVDNDIEITYNNTFDGMKKYASENGWFFLINKDDKPTIKDLTTKYE